MLIIPYCWHYSTTSPRLKGKQKGKIITIILFLDRGVDEEGHSLALAICQAEIEQNNHLLYKSSFHSICGAYRPCFSAGSSTHFPGLTGVMNQTIEPRYSAS